MCRMLNKYVNSWLLEPEPTGGCTKSRKRDVEEKAQLFTWIVATTPWPCSTWKNLYLSACNAMKTGRRWREFGKRNDRALQLALHFNFLCFNYCLNYWFPTRRGERVGGESEFTERKLLRSFLSFCGCGSKYMNRYLCLSYFRIFLWILKI